QIVPRMVITITREEDQKKLEEVFDSMDIPMCFQFRGKGTATSEMMDIFGLRGTTRLLTGAFLSKTQVKPLFEMMNRQLSFRHKGGGIAITVPVIGMQSCVLELVNDENQDETEKELKGDETEMKEKSGYALIWVSVTGGYSDDVVDAARNAGAKGGTVMKGRRRSSERTSHHFGISMQEEQEFVMIVVPREKKNDTMSAIMDACGLHTKAHGVVWSLPVDEVMGLAD
ncbi:MAG: P-II family nitrogen regulator, partial [Lachnospiraceae bacterium]|nr:P-II family nitrogen regulator [Lachnospiraceae bacterium]